MAVIEGGVSGALAGVGVEAASPQHVTPKPIPVGVLGHYRTSHRCMLVANQAATGRLFEIRNASATDLIVLTRLRVVIMQTAGHTAAIENSIDVFKATGFTVSSTTNTVTPAISKSRTSFGTAGGIVRGLTVAGAAAGMTGGTATKDGNALFQVPIWLLVAVPTAGSTPREAYDYTPWVTNGASPPILAQSEGLIVESRALLGAAAGSAIYIDIAWAETTAY